MTAPFVPKARQIQSAPIVPPKDGQPPTWVVACLDCGWAHDAHGLSAEDAVKSLAESHQDGHHLIARSIDYTQGWTLPGKPLEGIPARTGPHPTYSA